MKDITPIGNGFETLESNDIGQPRRHPRFATALAAILMVPLPMPEASAQDYQLADLGIDVSPADINNQGTIVGSRKTDTGNVAFRLLAGGQLEDIPDATMANALAFP